MLPASIVTIGFVIAVAYLLGSIPTAYLIARRRRGVDIREVGERYSGAKNVFREVGPLWGAVTAAADIAKGAVAVLVARALLVPDEVLVAVGLAAVAGHIWPAYLEFRGGAGFATALGVTLAALPRESGLLLVPYALLAVTLGRRTGLGVPAVLLLLPLVFLAAYLGERPPLIALAIAVAALVGLRVYFEAIRSGLSRLFQVRG